MINMPLPSAALQDNQQLYYAVLQCLTEIQRRAIDGTVSPLFADYVNSRVLIGGTSSTGNNSTVQVQTGDLEITTSGKGVIIADDGGTGHTARVTATYDSTTNNWTLSVNTIS